MAGEDIEEIRNQLKRCGQEHVTSLWSQLSEQERDELLEDLSTVNLEEMVGVFNKTVVSPEKGKDMTSMIPIEAQVSQSVSSSSPAELKKLRECGLKAISEGQVGVVCLAGGQGTRLGVSYPKGMYDVGLPSNKSLYQVQVERLLRLQELSCRLTGAEAATIPFYIMTSEHTKAPTLQFFKENNYFGLKEEQIVVFEQRTIPAFDFQGKFLMENRSKLARSPDGNGGLYWALRDQGILTHMEERGVSFLHVYCVDNILVKVADPVFMGYCISRGADAGNKVVEKNSPTEGVGVVCRVEGKVQVVEYSEISPENAEMREDDGKLTYRAGNICNHFFTREFLERVCCSEEESRMPQHIAKKKVPCVDLQTGDIIKPTQPNGIKFEKFVFDVFEFSKHFVVWECVREDEFSPLKCADSPGAQNTPSTAREALLTLHRKWLLENGAEIDEETRVEISPLDSYDGESLEGIRGVKLESGVLTSITGFTNGHSS